MEDHGLAGQLGGVILGESDVDVLLLTGLHADDLIFKTGHEAAGAQLQVVTLALAAVKGHATRKALEVDVGGVTLLGSPVHADKAAVTVGHFIQAGVHIGSHHFDLRLGSLQALVLAQLYLGVHGHGALEGAALGVHALQLHLGIAHHVQLLLRHGGLIGVGQHDIHGFLIKDLCAVHLLDDLARRLAGAEAGHVDLAAHLQIRLVDSGLKLLSADGNGQCHSALLYLLAALDIHG